MIGILTRQGGVGGVQAERNRGEIDVGKVGINLAVGDGRLKILPAGGVVRIGWKLRRRGVAGCTSGVHESGSAEIEIDAAGHEVLHKDAWGVGVVRCDAFAVRGGIVGAKALKLGEGIRDTRVGGQRRSLASSNIRVGP